MTNVKYFIKNTSAFICILFQIFSATAAQSSPYETRDLGDSPRIIGGTLAPINTYPWFAKALTSTNNWDGCGGSLVAPEFVLTAAHCLPKNTVAKYQIGAFCDQADNCGQVSQIVNIQTKYSHPNYNKNTDEYDFALIKLASRVTVTNPVKMDQGTISPNYPAGKRLKDYCRNSTTGTETTHHIRIHIIPYVG